MLSILFSLVMFAVTPSASAAATVTAPPPAPAPSVTAPIRHCPCDIGNKSW